MNNGVHEWLKIAEAPARWEDLQPHALALGQLLECIEERIVLSVKAMAALEALDLPEPENTVFPVAVADRRQQFTILTYGSRCQKSRTPHCLPPIIQEGFCHLRAAEQALRVHQEHRLSEEPIDIIDRIHQPVYDTILVFHEMIHRFLRVRESK